MKKRNFNKKKMVVSRGEHDMLRDIMTDAAFFDTFTVCDKLVTTMLAEAAMVHVAFTDILQVNAAKLN